MLPQQLKQLLRPFEPSVIKDLRLRRALSRVHHTFSTLTLEQTFDKIYADNQWGGRPGEFCSGPGSDDSLTDRYCELIRAFMTTHALATVVDLGCGDFRVGRRICSPSYKYIGVDIVPSLIYQLNTKFGSENASFQHLNIAEQIPPDGDLCLIRQVLQHLSNAEIERVLRNVQKYRYLIITEHIPLFPEHFNLDKPHGPDIRLSKNSGVFLNEPPFSLNIETLQTVPIGVDQAIRTVMVQNGI